MELLSHLYLSPVYGHSTSSSCELQSDPSGLSPDQLAPITQQLTKPQCPSLASLLILQMGISKVTKHSYTVVYLPSSTLSLRLFTLQLEKNLRLHKLLPGI